MPPLSRREGVVAFRPLPELKRRAFSCDGSPSETGSSKKKRLSVSSRRALPHTATTHPPILSDASCASTRFLWSEARTSACRSPATTTRRATRAFRPPATRTPRGRTRGPGRFSHRPRETRATTPVLTRTRTRARRTHPLSGRPRRASPPPRGPRSRRSARRSWRADVSPAATWISWRCAPRRPRFPALRRRARRARQPRLAREAHKPRCMRGRRA